MPIVLVEAKCGSTGIYRVLKGTKKASELSEAFIIMCKVTYNSREPKTSFKYGSDGLGAFEFKIFPS